MHEIRMESLLGLSLDQADRSTIYKESTSKMFPPIGSRVRRGPDWHWEDQDHGGPGTVVGHAEEGKDNNSVVCTHPLVMLFIMFDIAVQIHFLIVGHMYAGRVSMHFFVQIVTF